jgi:hypothetical protein
MINTPTVSKLNNRQRVCQVPYPELSHLVREALRLGAEISYIGKIGGVPGTGAQRGSPDGEFHKVKLPAGHRFFPDCLREQEARFLSWLISRFEGDCWFCTFTFKDYVKPEKAQRLLSSYLARLNQAYREVSRAGLLKSVTCSEWQQRDVIHFHSLIAGDGLRLLSRKRWEFRWRSMSNGFAAHYEAEAKAALYLVKHQIKDNPSGALHLGGSWRDINLPRGLERCCSVSKGFRGVEDSPSGFAGVFTALKSNC